MNDHTLAVRNMSTALADPSKLAARIKLMIYNGKKLSDGEAEALAVYSMVNDLNPFVGECYYLPGIGPGPGIAGWRKKADEQLEYEARRAAQPSARFWCDYVDPDPREVGVLAAGDIAVKAVLHDTITKTAWEQRVLSHYIELVKAGEKDIAIARELAGSEPVWSAIGIVRTGENFGGDKMPRYERACKRAEKAAIRKRFPRVYLPEPEGYDEALMVDGQFSEAPEQPRHTIEENVAALGFAPEEPETTTTDPAVPTVLSTDAGNVVYRGKADPTQTVTIQGDTTQTAEPPASNKTQANPKLQALIDAGLAENVFDAAGMLNKAKPTPKTVEDAVAWGHLYRGWRDIGADPKQAAEKANGGQKPE